MSSGSGTDYPVMNRRLCCTQTWQKRENEMDEEREMGEPNKMSLLFKDYGRRTFFAGAKRVVHSQL